MDFEWNDIQEELAKTVREFGSKRSPLSRLRELRKSELGWELDVWREMSELGWLMAPFSEEVGGLGGAFADAAIVLEHFGHTLIPEPYLPSVVAGFAFALCGDDKDRDTYMAPLLSGEQTATLAWAEPTGRYDITSPSTKAEPSEGGFRLHGEKVWVLNGHQANHLLVTAQTPEGPGLFVVPRDAKGLQVQVAKQMDSHKAARLVLEGVQVSAEQRLGSGDITASLERIFDIGAAAAVAEGLGIAQASLVMTLEYLGTREQFGAKIGSFQALQHRAVDMFVEVELLRSISMAAMMKVDDPDPNERKRWVSAAKTQLTQGGRKICQEAVQLHGGIGVTDEHDIGLFFKRMHVLNALYGDEAFHTERFASLPEAG